MADSRKNIKVQPEAFEALKADKPDGCSWSYYLTNLRTLESEDG